MALKRPYGAGRVFQHALSPHWQRLKNSASLTMAARGVPTSTHAYRPGV